MAEYKNLRATQVILDPENPRLADGTSSDREAVNRLLGEGYVQLVALARDLVEQGESNPTELPIVIRQGTKFLVLEGNRRFAALKLLIDPKLADDPSHQATFMRLKGTGVSPITVHCMVAGSRDEADHWITLRHTGANGGVGVRNWNASQTARHRRRMKMTVDSGTSRSIAIADELTETYQSDLAFVEILSRVRSEKLTNIGRFFSPGVLKRLRLEIRHAPDTDHRTLWAKYDSSEMYQFFQWAIRFLDGNSVDAFKNDEIRDNLLDKNPEVMPNLAVVLDEARRLADDPYAPISGTMGQPSDHSGDVLGEHGDEGANESSPNSGGYVDGSNAVAFTDSILDDLSRNGRKSDQRPEKFLYSSVKLPNLSANVQRLLREAKQLTIDNNYAIACVLSRVILELTVSDPRVLAWSGARDSDQLAVKIKKCIWAIDPEIERPRKRTRSDLTQAFSEADGIGVAYMHQFVHNPLVKADPHLARRFSATYTPFLNAVNGALT